MKDLFTLIRMRYVNFSRVERMIADFVLSSPERAEGMSISDLAKACQAGETSVFRFCRDIGETGYQDFQRHLTQSLAASDAARPAEPAVSVLSVRDGPAELARKLYEYHANVLRETRLRLRDETITEAARALLSARGAHFIGLGSSAAIAQAAQERFSRLRGRVYFSMDEHMLMMDAAIMEKSDAALLIVCSGEEKDALYIAEMIRRRGAKLIGIGRSEDSSFGRLCDVFMGACMYDDLMMDSAFSTQVSQLYLLDVLYALAYNLTKGE